MFVSHDLLSIPINSQGLIDVMSLNFRISAPQFGFLHHLTLEEIKAKDEGNGVKFIWPCYKDQV